MNVLSNGWHRRRPGIGRRVLLTAVCVLAPAINLVACRIERLEARSVPDTRAVAVVVRPAGWTARQANVSAAGTIAPRTSIDLAFQVAGMVMAVGVEEGEEVAAGELVAVLDPTDYALTFEQAKVEYLGAADEARKARVMRTADGAAAPNAYDRVLATEALAKIAAARAEKRLFDTQLASPLAGMVARRLVKPGAMVSPGTPAFTIVDLAVVHVRVGVTEKEISGIHRGADAAVLVPALDSARFAGKVRLVGVAADPVTHLFTVEIEVPNPEHRLKPGMSAHATIGTAVTTTTMSVPRVALSHDSRGGPQVYVYAAGERRVRARAVVLGVRRGAEVDVASGLSAGDMVVVGSREPLRDGMAVRPINEPVVVVAAVPAE